MLHGGLMLARFRNDPLVGNVLGLIALFIALGAGAYAAGLAPNSVKSRHIKAGNVRSSDLAPASVNSSKLTPGSIQSELVPDDELVGGDIDEGSLGSVPNANEAGDADLLDGKDSGEFQGVGSEGWTPLPLNTAAVPIGCNWTNFGGGFADASYFRDRDGIVHLRGLVRAIDGTTQACGTVPGFDEFIVLVGGLPAGYVPQSRALLTVSSNNKPGRVDVLANGSIMTQPGYPTTADTEAWVSLDGISFRCGPSGQNGCP
jgi:hypothetical protein